MTLSRAKYKRLPDLYVTGQALVLRDGQVMWLQALNPLERDEAQHDAHVARSRLVMALKSDAASDERTKLEGAFLEDGHDAAVERIIATKMAAGLWTTVESIQNDPDWAERIEIVQRSSDLVANAVEDAERQLVEQINLDYLVEIQKRQDNEKAFLERTYTDMPEDKLTEEYIDIYLDQRGGEVAQAEFALTEIWFAARCCEATRSDEEGEWDHSACETHSLRVYESKADVRALPEDLQEQLATVMLDINMQVREAKNSVRQESSSDSSLLPSKPAESTPSTQEETPSEPPGTSSTPSATPLAS